MKKCYLFCSLWKEHGGAPGLGKIPFDLETGMLGEAEKLNDSISFNYSKVDLERNMLYISNETDTQAGSVSRTGRIYGYEIEKKTGDLKEKFCRDTGCPNPSYLALDPTGKYMVVTHHSTSDRVTKLICQENGRYVPVTYWNDSAVELFRVNENGTLGDLVDVVQHMPDRPVVDRFGRPGNCHPHCAVFAPDGEWFAVCDKGDGYVYTYKIDYEKEKLVLRNRYLTDSETSAPRYCVFHPTLPYLYINHEHADHGKMNISVFCCHKDGVLEKIQVCNVLMEGDIPVENRDKSNEQQGLCIHPNGKYLYTIVHAYQKNSVGVFAVDSKTGKLRLLENASVKGEWPRGGVISPDGRHFLTSCLASGDISVYKIGADGRLRPNGSHAVLKGCSYMSFYEQENERGEKYD